MRRCGNQARRFDVDLSKLDDDADHLSRLSAEELALFEKLLLKIAGAFEGDVVPPFRVEFVNRRHGMIEELDDAC
jgi:hypothetical protein